MRFDRFIMVDWSAASVPGPKRETADQIWIGWCDAGNCAAPEAAYQRTRLEAEHRIRALVEEADGPVVIGFDFPFGYPAGAKLGGGRALGKRLASLLEDGPDNRNNRFAVAAALNEELSPNGTGPFWGCPTGKAGPHLSTTRNDVFGPSGFLEHRAVDQRLRPLGIQTCWKLAYPASVGSQILMGMPAVYRLAEALQARIWPFETDWNRSLAPITITEIWPRLFDHDREDHAIRDARQVIAASRWMRDNAGDGLIAALGRPPDLGDAGNDGVLREEGWIVGAGTGLA